MVFETFQSKCLLRWQVPMTPVATRAVLLQKFSGGAKQMLCFVFAGKPGSSRGVAGSRLTWCWGLAIFRVTAHRELLHPKKKDEDETKTSLFHLSAIRRTVLHPHPSWHCQQQVDLFIFVSQGQIILLHQDCSGVQLIQLWQPPCAAPQQLLAWHHETSINLKLLQQPCVNVPAPKERWQKGPCWL